MAILTMADGQKYDTISGNVVSQSTPATSESLTLPSGQVISSADPNYNTYKQQLAPTAQPQQANQSGTTMLYWKDGTEFNTANQDVASMLARGFTTTNPVATAKPTPTAGYESYNPATGQTTYSSTPPAGLTPEQQAALAEGVATQAGVNANNYQTMQNAGATPEQTLATMGGTNGATAVPGLTAEQNQTLSQLLQEKNIGLGLNGGVTAPVTVDKNKQIVNGQAVNTPSAQVLGATTESSSVTVPEYIPNEEALQLRRKELGSLGIPTTEWSKYITKDPSGKLFYTKPQRLVDLPSSGISGGGTTIDESVGTGDAFADPMADIQGRAQEILAKYGLTAPESTKSPTAAFADTYKQLYKDLGLDTLKDQMLAMNKEVEKIDNEMYDKIAEVNDNPWLTEGLRVKKVQQVKDKYEARKESLVNRLKLDQALYEQGQEEAKFVAQSVLTISHNQEVLDQQMLLKAMEIAENEQDALRRMQFEMFKEGRLDPSAFKEVQGGLYDVRTGKWVINPTGDKEKLETTDWKNYLLSGGNPNDQKGFQKWLSGNSDMNETQQKLFNNLADKYAKDEIIRQYDSSKGAIAVANQVIADPSKATNQLKTLYLLVKNLDPTSAVREGELSLAQSTQSYFDKFKTSITRISKGQVLSPSAALELAQATKELFGTWELSKKARDARYASQARVSGIEDAWNSYQSPSGSEEKYNTSGLPVIRANFDSAVSLIRAYPQYGDIVKQMIDDGLEDRDIIQILTGQSFSSVGGDTNKAAMRTDRHNNPTAFTTDIAKLAGLKEGVDYIAGDSFSEGKYKTAKLLKDPVATTIKVIDKIGFYTSSGGQRWTHTAMSQSQWNKLSYSQKTNVIKQMYQREGGTQLLNKFA